jgi:hypothetical protein
LKIKNYKFERVENFKYLGVILNEDNSHHTDLLGLKNANKTYFMLTKFKTKTYLKAKIKTEEHKITDKTLTYASETWILTEIESN